MLVVKILHQEIEDLDLISGLCLLHHLSICKCSLLFTFTEENGLLFYLPPKLLFRLKGVSEMGQCHINPNS